MLCDCNFNQKAARGTILGRRGERRYTGERREAIEAKGEKQEEKNQKVDFRCCI